MYPTNEFRKGLRIELDGVPFQIVEFQHVSPGKGSAFTRTKLRNMLNQNVIERTFKSGDKVDRANMEQKQMQFLYADGDGYHFMNTADYDQVALQKELLGDAVGYLQEHLEVQIMYYNERPISIELPHNVALRVAQTDPAFKGDTVTGGTKPAKLETGAVVAVPFHISEGDMIRVDTRDGTYIEKVNK